MRDEATRHEALRDVAPFKAAIVTTLRSGRYTIELDLYNTFSPIGRTSRSAPSCITMYIRLICYVHF